MISNSIRKAERSLIDRMKKDVQKSKKELEEYKKQKEMISTTQLQSLEFEFNMFDQIYEFKDITVDFTEQDTVEVKIQDFQVYGIRDVRDLRKLIELVYGS